MANRKFDENPAAALKQQWRQLLKIIRQEIDPRRRKEASELAYEKLKLLTQKAGFILSFASFGSEIDLWPYNKFLAEEGRLVLPRIADEELHLYQIQDFNHLESRTWGVQEPIPSLCCLVDLSEIVIALIPGLGFDPEAKTRLGYGGGYYDRLLAKTKSTQTWGVGFHEQLAKGLPCDTHDRPLNKIYLF